jgi:hypothetical protein
MDKNILSKQELYEIEMIYKEQVDTGTRVIILNTPSFRKLLETAKQVLTK